MGTTAVAIVGGGVAGLSAAHELAERGFSVDVVEARGAPGGKARSQYMAGTGSGGRRDLPGEHGFRFFPAFYRHVIDTMARIPDGRGSVADHLRAAPEAGVAMADGGPVARFLRCRPASLREWMDSFTFGFGRLGFAAGDALRFAWRVLRYYSSCARRRLEQYESMSWWDFLGGDRYSPTFQRHLLAVPRTMVAMDPRHGSARTVGDVSMQLLADHAGDGARADRLLCGPTSEKWIDPWRRHLEALGVRFHMGCAARAIHVRGGAIESIELDDGRSARADQFVLALPLEALRPLVGEELAALDPDLARLRALPRSRFARLTSWMSGIQFYLRRDVPVVRGHLLFPDAPWALTCVSQAQFWRGDGPLETRYGDGSVRGLISVDISDFDTPGTFVRRRARDCSPAEIASEVWQQLRAALRSRRGALLTDDDLVTWHLDDDLEARPGGGMRSLTPLLVHPPGSWHERPEAVTRVPNLTLAGDHVRTHTNIASMEGANESARRAVNGILDRCDSAAPRCAVWPLVEPALFDRAKQMDERLLAVERAGRHLLDLLPTGDRVLAALTGAPAPATR
ncbi:MAG TPA: FAD-dependent oxidoreductase [Kofleriaceae bacterium]|nr:FAD-dependent oxidoreductase [Kofleriaceae bacterium]